MALAIKKPFIASKFPPQSWSNQKSNWPYNTHCKITITPLKLASKLAMLKPLCVPTTIWLVSQVENVTNYMAIHPAISFSTNLNLLLFVLLNRPFPFLPTLRHSVMIKWVWLRLSINNYWLYFNQGMLPLLLNIWLTRFSPTFHIFLLFMVSLYA